MIRPVGVQLEDLSYASCMRADGRAKEFFATKREAKAVIRIRKLDGCVPYRCQVHGWHIGHGRR